MVARNDITGDAIQTKSTSSSYRDNYDNIFRKNTCGCGRSPTGSCVGWHGLTEDEFAQRKELYETGKVDLQGKDVN